MKIEIPGFEGLYQADELGNIYSLISNKKLTPSIDKGYKVVTLCKCKKRYMRRVHRLIGLTILYNPDKLPCINHKNGIRSDNRAENLEWCTYSHNTQHAYDTGLLICRTGPKHHNSKLTQLNVDEIRKRELPVYILAKKFNVSQPTICDIQKGRTWQKN